MLKRFPAVLVFVPRSATSCTFAQPFNFLTTLAIQWLALFGTTFLSPGLAWGQSDQSKPSPTANIDFQSEIAPIFRDHCIQCHQPGIEKGGISLANGQDLLENEFVNHEDIDASYLIELVTSKDGKPPEMPQNGKPLTGEQINTLRRWIKTGSPWPDGFQIRSRSKSGEEWWAWQPLQDPIQDALGKKQWNPRTVAKSIDELITLKLKETGLERRKAAGRRTLIRRATFDLTGLPPTPQEITAFLNDKEPRAYERLLDRLLASPAYGERWGRHWLDVVRFGESNGFERNVIIPNLWPFRDYVIRSLNKDKPFNQFIQEHIAGDVMAPNDPASVIGTAFLVAGPYDNVGNQDAVQKAQIRANTLDEMIRATGESFLGLTLGCARCHDHKFDPLTQEDYYSFYATLAGVTHGSADWASEKDRQEHQALSKPLQSKKSSLKKQIDALDQSVLSRGRSKLEIYQQEWTREPILRAGTEDRFATTEAKFVRLVCEAKDTNLNQNSGFGIEEFQIFGPENTDKNLALAKHGSIASGKARDIQDFKDAYGPQLAIDGQTGRRFIAASNQLMIELPTVSEINRIRFSSCTPDQPQEHSKFTFVAEYRLEVSLDGENFTEVASSHDRKPISIGGDAHLNHRLLNLEWTQEELAKKASLNKELSETNQALGKVKPLRKAWIGFKKQSDATGPFFVFYGGSPQKKGPKVTSSSIRFIDSQSEVAELGFRLGSDSAEAERRKELAQWITNDRNPLTPRVLANRVWAYHFGSGIVETPNDFGYMGGRPSHPELLDFLASRLIDFGWQLKPMHRAIMLSKTYRQSSKFHEESARIDSESRLLWRFPPRRLSAEEIRDSILMISGLWQPNPNAGPVPDGGPGFRLYEYLQDNVATYVPLDQHGPETFRRAVYHQNARASVVDLMTDFDQPDCAFSVAKRANTTTPLQALTLMNHKFTLDAAQSLASRIGAESTAPEAQVDQLYQLAYGRQPKQTERKDCLDFLKSQDLPALCRAILNTHELIYVD